MKNYKIVNGPGEILQKISKIMEEEFQDISFLLSTLFVSCFY